MASVTAAAALKMRLEKVSHGIDDHGVLYTPLDFSFMQIAKPADALEKSPRRVSRSVKRSVAKKKEKTDEKKDGEEEGEVNKEKFETNSLRLNNNRMTELRGLTDVIERLLVGSYAALQWLDISFNKLPSIDKVFLLIPNLKILYMHGNKVAEFSEVDKLAVCNSLRKLTLHGNPLDQIPGYRSYVLSRVPQLLNFDMTPVSNGDRANADTYRAFRSTTKRNKVDAKGKKLISPRP